MTLPGLLPENEAAWVPAEFKSINHHQSSSIISSSSSSSSFQIRVGKKTQHWIIGQIGHFPKNTTLDHQHPPAHDQVGEEASAGHKILTLDQPGPMDREWPWNHHTHDWPKNQVILEIESPGNLDSKPANR